MKQISASDIATLPIQDRIQLVEEIWDSIMAAPGVLNIPEWHRKELDKRLEAYHSDSKAGVSWEEMKHRFSDER